MLPHRPPGFDPVSNQFLQVKCDLRMSPATRRAHRETLGNVRLLAPFLRLRQMNRFLRCICDDKSVIPVRCTLLGRNSGDKRVVDTKNSILRVEIVRAHRVCRQAESAHLIKLPVVKRVGVHRNDVSARASPRARALRRAGVLRGTARSAVAH